MTQHPTDDLGLYALGLLDRDERDEIEGHLADCALCQTELAAHRATLAALAPEPAMPAAADLRQRIVARHERSWWRGLPALGYAASAVLAVALVTSVSALVQERATRDEYAGALAALAAGGQVIPLATQGDAQASGAIVMSREGVTYLVFRVPPPPAGKAYEAWVIRDGAPRPAGMAPITEGFVTLRLSESLRNGDVAALTLEDHAGAQLPTTNPILLGRYFSPG